MVLQAYDYFHLFQNYHCELQMGGNDQWGNMLAGTELIRKVTGKDAHALTFPLITTSLGHKMGKTEKGTIWLDGSLTEPYEYYQYWVNCDDADLERFLKLFTFLPLEEISAVEKLSDQKLNMAKAVLAYEATKITHGTKAAQAAWRASMEAFGFKPVEEGLFPSSDIPREAAQVDTSAIPRYRVTRKNIEDGLQVTTICSAAGLTQSLSEAKRLIAQGGIYINDRQVKSADEKIASGDFGQEKEIRLRKGKKKYLIVEMKN
jgi:tyrosyl-tRNA synthetase